MDLSSPVTTLPGIGGALGKKLEKLGIKTVFDFLYHLPFRYEDRTFTSAVDRLQPGETSTVIGKITSLKNEFTHRGKFIQVGQVTDGTGSINVIWFNQPYLVKSLAKNQGIALWGKVDYYKNLPALVSPDFEIPSGILLHMGRIVPIYPETAGISSKWLRTKIHHLLSVMDTAEILPPDIDMPGWLAALKDVHFPQNLETARVARNRLAFDELFLLQLASLIRKDIWERTRLTHAFIVDQEKILKFMNNLPFSLTASQNRSLKEILSDLSLSRPMNRLLEGDVGSGKTVVAAVAAYVAHLNGFRTVILAPTQILAEQHFQTFSAMFKPYGVDIGLITGASKLKIENTKLKIVVGTHALLSQNLNFSDVGLVVIDEQHRFGVMQRSRAAKIGETPHTLTMTATPIPRTVALAMYGDLDLSVLDAKPAGRLPVKTWVVPEYKRESSYKWLNDQMVKYASQAFWVCPFIEDSDTLTSVKAAKAEFIHLQEIFPRLKLGLLHGKLKAAEKNDVLDKFRSKKLDILVATPVVEVGLDIPGAALMIIEGAERFGLAQLHQLRGRVGRSQIQSYCLLFTSDETGITRLKNLEHLDSGMELAEADLKYRGPGEIYGTAQHGFPDFKVATYDDFSLIEKARSVAQKTLPKLQEYPLLRQLIKEDKIHIIEPN